MFDWVICLQKYWNFQSETKVEQIIAIVATPSVSCLFYFFPSYEAYYIWLYHLPVFVQKLS